MCFYIGIEDLAANALIVALSKRNKRFLTYSEIENYGSSVVQLLNKKGEKAVLILSRESTNDLFRNYSDFFEEQENEGSFGISLKEGIQINDLIVKFRGYLALDVLMAFVDKYSIKALGV